MPRVLLAIIALLVLARFASGGDDDLSPQVPREIEELPSVNPQQTPLATLQPHTGIEILPPRVIFDQLPSQRQADRFSTPGSFMFTAPRARRILRPLDAFQAREQIQIRDPNDPRRHIGVGEPLVGSSWLNRPNHIGWLFGGQLPAELPGAEQDGGALGGYRLGWDLSHYFGAEITFAFSKVGLEGDAAGSRNLFYDLRANYYPLGDARWRPYLGAGIGLASFSYVNTSSTKIDETHVLFPLAMGLKYRCKPWLALRFELTDFISIGGEGVVNNFALHAGVEVHYGNTFKDYGPWSL